jgi:hypothetical protein
MITKVRQRASHQIFCDCTAVVGTYFMILHWISAGDLSKEIDSRVKNSVADFCGKDEYEVGDLSSEIDKRSRAKVFDFIGKEVRLS